VEVIWLAYRSLLLADNAWLLIGNKRTPAMYVTESFFSKKEYACEELTAEMK
jgi:hypothetical protein